MIAKSPFSEFVWLEPHELASAPLKSGFAYWQSLCAGRPWPTREDLNPRFMTGLLGYMLLVKVIDGGADFEHRIVGDVLVQAFSVPIQHRTFSDIAYDAPEQMETSFQLFRQVVEDGRPLAWHQHSGLDTTHVVFTDSEIILMPLGHERVDHVLGFGVHHATVKQSPAHQPAAPRHLGA